MVSRGTLLLTLDLTGTFAFALNGALVAVQTVRLDIVGVVTLGMITAIGGGILRDVLIQDLPPESFDDWRYLTAALLGALIAFTLSTQLTRVALTIIALDAVGLSLFAVTGATKALAFGAGAGQAVILGAVTAVGGGALRDVLTAEVPTILRSGLYALPALMGSAVVVLASLAGARGPEAAIVGASGCFLLRMVGVHMNLNAPLPPGTRPSSNAGAASERSTLDAA